MTTLRQPVTDWTESGATMTATRQAQPLHTGKEKESGGPANWGWVPWAGLVYPWVSETMGITSWHRTLRHLRWSGLRRILSLRYQRPQWLIKAKPRTEEKLSRAEKRDVPGVTCCKCEELRHAKRLM